MRILDRTKGRYRQIGIETYRQTDLYIERSIDGEIATEREIERERARAIGSIGGRHRQGPSAADRPRTRQEIATQSGKQHAKEVNPIVYVLCTHDCMSVYLSVPTYSIRGVVIL